MHVLLQDLIKWGSAITPKFYKQFGSSAAELPVKFKINIMVLTPSLVA